MGREEVGGSAEARNLGEGKRKAYCGLEAAAERCLGWENDFAVKA